MHTPRKKRKMNTGKTILVTMVLVGCGTRDNLGSVSQLACTETGEGGEGCCPGSPIILDLAGDGVHLTSAETGVLFELHPGRLGMWAWTAASSDDAFLALDLDGNGFIDSGAELFGDGAIQVASANPNGFAALAWYDLSGQGGNGDGVIDRDDDIWGRLRLWRDVDHDGWSSTGELQSLDTVGVRSFSLSATLSDHVDAHGNEFRMSAPIVANSPIGRVASDVWLTQAPIPSELISRGPLTSNNEDDQLSIGLYDYIEWTCWAWAYAVNPEHPTLPCELPGVASGPLVQVGIQSTRYVSRASTNTNRSTATTRARTSVFNLLFLSTTAWCDTAPYPAQDPAFPPPYEPNPMALIQAKCFSTIVSPPGGGCSG